MEGGQGCQSQQGRCSVLAVCIAFLGFCRHPVASCQTSLPGFGCFVSVCFACWMLFWVVFGVGSISHSNMPKIHPHFSGGAKVRSKESCRKTSRVTLLQSLVRICLVLGSCRVGEALNPGPCVNEDRQTWSLGICNPTGLNSKVDQCAFLDGDVWLISESHLTEHGFHRFKKGMTNLQSKFKYFATGSPVKSRGDSDVGKFSGVMAMSSLPLRPLPAHFDPQVFASSRIQVFGLAIADWWVTTGIVYGYPDSAAYPNRTYMNEVLVDEIVQRVAFQSTGARIIAGDFNQGPQDLEQFEVLRKVGFREIQDIGLQRWGRRIQPTCVGPKNIDQIWLSPEMQAILLDYHLREDDWAGHSSIQCVFASQNTPLIQYDWHMPVKLEWPNSWTQPVQVDWTSDLTEQYATFWFQVESHAVATHEAKGGRVSPKALGRAQTLQTVKKWQKGVPCKLGRHGGLNPNFFGYSLQHCHFFKQLRRLEALKRMMQSSKRSELHGLKRVELWRTIRHAAGFPQGFGKWWHDYITAPFQYLPLTVPSLAEVIEMFEHFNSFVRKFEDQLIRCRVNQAKQSRQKDLNMVFRDCQQSKPEKVDTLVISTTAEVDDIHHDDFSLVLKTPVSFVPDVPLVCNGQPLEVVMHDHDQIWVEALPEVRPGDIIRQDRVLSTDHDILQEFCRVWKPRWQKASHVLDSQWQQIMDFSQATFQPIQWDHQPWSLSTFQRALHFKKSSAATGPDGVSRLDLVSLPVEGQQALTDMYTAIENRRAWPLQLTRGFVNSLFKNKSDGGARLLQTSHGLSFAIQNLEFSKGQRSHDQPCSSSTS